MATVIRDVGNTAVRDLLYARPSAMLTDYHESVFGEGGLATHFSERFKERARKSIDSLSRSRAIRETKAVFRKIKNSGRIDRIERLADIGAMQHAPPRMQHMIMANEKVRRRWQAGRLEGYADGYARQREQYHAVKHSHATYRMIEDGHVQKDGDEYVAHSYALQASERDVLSVMDKAEIRQTWASVEEKLWENLEDPTSTYNAML